jgi:Family of unknown function (DUF6495)
MKYTRLTKEQLEELHPEFINFLASQSIDKKEWDHLKKNKPEIAMEEIDVFSDVIWDRALTNVKFVDHFSANYIFLFRCDALQLDSIVINTTKQNIDFLTQDGLNWLGENLFSEAVDIKKGEKKVTEENRNEEVFKIIEKGGIISKGDLFLKIFALIQNN